MALQDIIDILKEYEREYNETQVIVNVIMAKYKELGLFSRGANIDEDIKVGIADGKIKWVDQRKTFLSLI